MKYIQGDIIEAFKKGKIDFILNQNNCVAGMGAGIANRLAIEYPDLDYEDKKFRKSYEPNLWELAGSILFYHEEEYDPTTGIFNIYSQYHTGSPTTLKDYDCFEQRLLWLKKGLININAYHSGSVGIPLLASGLAADPKRKKNMSDLEYFKTFIAPTVESVFPDCNVYYL